MSLSGVHVVTLPTRVHVAGATWRLMGVGNFLSITVLITRPSGIGVTYTGPFRETASNVINAGINGS